ncbi:MAG: substrate-binding domain-containing protein, partial [Planctomycetota bacterium]
MKALNIMLAAAIGMGLLSGCDPQDETATSSSEGRLFAISFQTMNNPFFVDLNEGIKEVVETHGDRLVTLDAQFNSLKQKNDVSDMILQRASGIFINPVNWEGSKRQPAAGPAEGHPVHHCRRAGQGR